MGFAHCSASRNANVSTCWHEGIGEDGKVAILHHVVSREEVVQTLNKRLLFGLMRPVGELGLASFDARVRTDEWLYSRSYGPRAVTPRVLRIAWHTRLIVDSTTREQLVTGVARFEIEISSQHQRSACGNIKRVFSRPRGVQSHHLGNVVHAWHMVARNRELDTTVDILQCDRHLCRGRYAIVKESARTRPEKSTKSIHHA